jgi:hypothetical protein
MAERAPGHLAAQLGVPFVALGVRRLLVQDEDANHETSLGIDPESLSLPPCREGQHSPSG